LRQRELGFEPLLRDVRRHAVAGRGAGIYCGSGSCDWITLASICDAIAGRIRASHGIFDQAPLDRTIYISAAESTTISIFNEDVGRSAGNQRTIVSGTE
jgi:hypothetical protein